MKKLYMALIVVIVAFTCLRVAADSFADTHNVAQKALQNHAAETAVPVVRQ